MRLEKQATDLHSYPEHKVGWCHQSCDSVTIYLMVPVQFSLVWSTNVFPALIMNRQAVPVLEPLTGGAIWKTLLLV